MLSAAGDEGAVLAGGQSLVPLMNFRVAQPAHLVDINYVDELDYIRVDGGFLAIGARTRQATLERSADVAKTAPLLSEAIRSVAHPPVRHRGTVVGSIAHADPAAELPVVAVATGAEVTIAGPAGTRTVPIEDVLVSALVTALEDDEMITGLRFPTPQRWGFAEFARRHGDFALSTAVVAEIDGVVRIAVGGAGPVPLRSPSAEAVLADGGTAREAAAAAGADLDPTADLHGSAPFRRAMAAEMIRRALASAGVA
jgi:aerobic carbon-monoxide dehydrogenase medium subunit